ncbi:MAG: bifunctional diaminohydroxyphosphoribosylaminopyrimidine deaminase/5-amino-6-(5-phosphoribosylamino)uracil reductase RibD [Peptoniphilus sp.]|nr:bifunctional diaminohydroxyphosphoribosylaminopyrimidine deaminase/5-amino-6-(5-phosphoribosylamino)uracil reductase RibD [Peptoniphilus sp.]MDY3117940.1 bifunctional diaminohydroxyphosphoribosylaminopyrimidine deaminase/5-amino-6-(5-phosphoribosylamino)uracil reductase RibD [Peptoniphilus sp.]
MDEQYMSRALALARKGRGRTKTNPMVGAVLVKEGRIIAEGYHHGFGMDHAEVDCLKRVEESPEGGTLYVTLEPCSHYGKTPPCVMAIEKAKIARVVVGTLDPNPKVSGRGIGTLQAAGIQVDVGIMEEACKELNRAFFTGILTQTPYVICKFAATVDGKIATDTGESRWITSEEARNDGHKLRGMVDGILVGTNTVLKDNPRLSNRSGEGGNPTRIILDRRGAIPLDAHVFDGTQPTVVYTVHMDDASQRTLRNRGVVVEVVREKKGKLDLPLILEDVYKKDMGRILVEGGGRIHGSFIDEDLVDEFALYMAPTLLGGGKDGVYGRAVASLVERRDFVFKKVKAIGPDLYIGGVRRCLRES